MSENKNVNEGNAWTDNVWMVGVSMLIVGLIIGFLVGWYWQKSAALIPTDDGSQTAATSTDVVASSTVPTLQSVYKTIDTPATVSIDDQRAGNLVFIKHVDVSKPTWITVREIVDGSIGNILGAEMVTSATDDVPVTLLRPTKAGGQYAIFLYQDNGDGEFDFKTDLLVLQNSAQVSAMFTAQ